MRFILFVALVLLTASQSWAQTCSNPEGDVGVIRYNIDFGVMQGCTSAGWVSMHPPTCATGDGCLNCNLSDNIDPSLIPTYCQKTIASDAFQSLELDFLKSRYTVNGVAHSLATLPGLTFSRPGTAITYAETMDGDLVSFPPNTPRITNLGYLSEGTTTNLTRYSEQLDFNDGTHGWVTADGSIGVLPDVTLAPNGTMTADKIFENPVLSQKSFLSRSGWILPPNDLVISLFAKSAERNRVVVGAKSSGVIAGGVVVNLEDGTQQGTWARSPGNIGCQLISSRRMTNGWWHIQVFCRNITNQSAGMGALVSLTNTTAGNVVNEAYLGDGVSGVYIWGVQTESAVEDVLRYGSSYVPTTGTQVTRSADLMKLDTGDWFNQDQGTFVVTAKIMTEINTTEQAHPIVLSSSTDNDVFWELVGHDNRLNIGFTSPSDPFNPSYLDMHNKTFSASVRYSSAFTSRQGALNGALAAASDVTGDLLANPVRHLGIGINWRAVTSRHPFRGYVQRINYLPRAVEDGLLQSTSTSIAAAPSGQACEGPFRPVGTMLFNIDFGVLQSCSPGGWQSLHAPACPSGDACPSTSPCVSPDGATGETIYNADFGLFQVCTQRGWRATHSPTCPDGDGCNPCHAINSPAPGTTCSDGTIYVGLTPDGDVPMFTTPDNSPLPASLRAWNNRTLNWVDTPMENCTPHSSGTQPSCRTGQANTELLANLVDIGAPYLAANYCYNLDAHGRQDWYLPARDELLLLFANRDQGALAGTVNIDLWSSSEFLSNAAINILAAGNANGASKSGSSNFRCVRK